jgi:hypothetical protein
MEPEIASTPQQQASEPEHEPEPIAVEAEPIVVQPDSAAIDRPKKSGWWQKKGFF